MNGSIESMKNEEWRPVVGFEDHYEVSSLGRIRSHYTDRILKASAKPYPMVNLFRGGKRTATRVHDVVTAAFLGPKPLGMQVNHIDLDKTNNAISNLEYVTPAGNIHHAIRNGAIPCGESHYASIVTRDDAEAIISRFASGETRREISDSLGLAYPHVSRIISGRRWSHLHRPASVADREPDRPRGQEHPNAKLTRRKVEFALLRCARGESYRDVAASLGVTPELIGQIARGKAWKHVRRPRPVDIERLERALRRAA